MKKFIKKLAKKAEGFTLVELVVVIAILGILAGVAVPAYSGYLEKAKESGDITVLDGVKTAAMGALAKEGSVDEVTVSADGATITASLTGDDDPVVLKGTNAITSDFGTYFTDTFTLKSKKFEDGAKWNGSEWVAD